MTNEPAEGDAVEVWKRHVDDDRVRLVVMNQANDRSRQMRMNDPVTFMRQTPLETDGDDGIVFHEE